MKKIGLLFTFLLFSIFLKAQYNAAQHTVTNKAIGYAAASPADARSYFYDGTLFQYRPFNSTSEVLSYLNNATKRFGNFPVFIRFGSVTKIYMFKNGQADSNLVELLQFTSSDTTTMLSGYLRTISNIGSGFGLFKQITGQNAEFKTLIPGFGLSVVSGANELTFVADTTELATQYDLTQIGGNNTNIGGGFRWAVENTSNIKTLFTDITLLLDSTTNANALTLKSDTTILATQYDLTQINILANNGLSKSGDTIQLGGSLIKQTILSSSLPSNTLTITGANSFADGALLDVNTTGSVGIAIRGETTDGRGVVGNATTGVGVYGDASGSGGYGIFANSILGNSIYAQSNSGMAFEALIQPTSTNTVIPISSWSRTTTGFGADGIGGSFDFNLKTTTVDRQTHQLIFKLTDATDVSRTSSWEFWNLNNTVFGRKLEIKGNGQLTLDGYPSLTQQTDTTNIKPLGYNTSSGAVEPMANWISSSGGGSGVTTMAAIGSSPNANGASISGVTLTLQPASGSFGGVLTTASQTLAGLKTFNSGLIVNNTTLELSGGVNSILQWLDYSTSRELQLQYGGGEFFWKARHSDFGFYTVYTWNMDAPANTIVTTSTGNIRFLNLDTDGSAPTTSGTVRFVTTDGNGQLSFQAIAINWSIATANGTANYTISGNNYIILSDLTGQADRTVTLPSSPSSGQVLKIDNRNTNTSTFNWTTAGGTIKDAGDNTITMLLNQTIYDFIFDGVDWKIQN
jgi:hypothetical protein